MLNFPHTFSILPFSPFPLQLSNSYNKIREKSFLSTKQREMMQKKINLEKNDQRTSHF